MGKQAGQQPKFKSAKKLKANIDEYFKSCWGAKRDMFGNEITDKATGEKVLVQYKPYTFGGLAVFLGIARENLLDYMEGRRKCGTKAMSLTIKKAKAKIYQYAEEQLFMGKNQACIIFNLKNNYGWKDRTEVGHDIPDHLIDKFKGIPDEEIRKKIREELEK